MKKIWTILNSPLVVVLVALSVWPILGAYTGFKVMEQGAIKVKSAISEGLGGVTSEEQNQKILKKIEILKNINVKNINNVKSDWKGKEKIVAEIHNNTKHTIRSIHYSASFYDKGGELIDVTTSWMGSKFIQPDNFMPIEFTRTIGEHNDPDEILEKRKSDKIIINIQDFEIVENGP